MARRSSGRLLRLAAIFLIIGMLVSLAFFMSLRTKHAYSSALQHALEQLELPAYFDLAFRRTRKLEHLLANYAQWHSKTLDDVQQLLCASKASTGSKQKLPDVLQQHYSRFVIFKPHPNSGVGNIYLGLVSTFLYAVLANRVFLIDWNHKSSGSQATLHDLLQDPMFSSDTDSSDTGGATKQVTLRWDLHAFVGSLSSACPSVGSHDEFLKLFKQRKHFEVTPYYAQSMPSFHFLVCSSDLAKDSANGPQVMEMEAAQYFLPALYHDNTMYSMLLQTMFPNNRKGPIEQQGILDVWRVSQNMDQGWLEKRNEAPYEGGGYLRRVYENGPVGSVFGPLARLLLSNQRKEVADIINQFIKDVFEPLRANGAFILGVQIRRNPHENLFKDTDPNAFWDCVKERIAEISEQRRHSSITIFLTTDDTALEQQARSFFDDVRKKEKEEAIVIPVKVVTFGQKYSKDRSLQSIIRSQAEMRLLSQCDDIIATEKSTFGNVAHALANITPLVVMKKSSKQYGRCRRVRSTEPWFHLHFRVNMFTCAAVRKQNNGDIYK